MWHWKPIHRNWRWLWKGFLMLALVLPLLLFFATSRIRVIRLGYEIPKIKRELRELSQEVQAMERRLLSKTSLQALEKMAHPLGLRPPREEEVVLIEE